VATLAQFSGPHLISESVLRDADRSRETFAGADPFKHVIIEDFFEPSFAERLLADFPKFDLDLSRNEAGLTGGKAANPDIRHISPVYQDLYELIASVWFLDLVSRLSGIPDLLVDPKMYGGGTHENRDGQELDPHVDFNYDEAQQLHRRLNLIVYLNKNWQSEWGGALEIHSNPRDPDQNRIRSYDPLFNRCVMFETNEYSWHGFPKIRLPSGQTHLSRKSISIYLYTKERPAEEVAPMHATFYVQRPLPKHLVTGHVLTANDIEEMQKLLSRRDHWIELYQSMELEKNRQLAVQSRLIQDLKTHVRAPLIGLIDQTAAPAGLHADGWVVSHCEIYVRTLAPVSAIEVAGWRPDPAPPGRVHLSINDDVYASASVATGDFDLKLPLPEPLEGALTVTLSYESEDAWPTPDQRDLAFVLRSVKARHPVIQDLGELTARGIPGGAGTH
jgi:hypothetical protein